MNNKNTKKGFARAHTNIALIKYWGKKDAELVLPANDSISLTLDKFYTDTFVTFSKELTANQLFLNRTPMHSKNMGRINRMLEVVKQEFDYEGFAKIESYNHVPTSAGLASSASGMAALAGAAYSALSPEPHQNLNLRHISKIARLGSGSASRSIYGGIVQWHRGYDHESSYAEQIVPEDQIDLNMVTIVIDKHKKSIKSTVGMQRTVESSPFYPIWVEEANRSIPKMIDAVKSNDFTKIGQLAEHSAGMMHATTLSAIPSFTYFAPETIEAIKLVKQMRSNYGIECYFTIDAGPNVKVICRSKDVPLVQKSLQKFFAKRQLIVARPGSGLKFSKN